MLSQILFLSKVMICSTGLAIAVKVLGPVLQISPTPTHALIGVLGLPVFMLFFLIWQYFRQDSTPSQSR